MPDCVDLKEHFGHKYRVAYEESYAAERGERAFARDPYHVRGLQFVLLATH